MPLEEQEKMELPAAPAVMALPEALLTRVLPEP